MFEDELNELSEPLQITVRPEGGVPGGEDKPINRALRFFKAQGLTDDEAIAAVWELSQQPGGNGGDVPNAVEAPQPQADPYAIPDEMFQQPEGVPLAEELKQLSEPLAPWPGSDIPEDPFERAAKRVRQAAKPAEGGRDEGAFTDQIEALAIPRTPLDAAITVATLPVPALGPAARIAALSTGMVLDSFSDAKAAPRGRPKAVTDEQKELAKIEAAKKKQQLSSEMIDAVVETIGGPAKVKASEYGTIGVLAAVSMGAIAAPWIYRKFKMGAVPKFRTVEDAAPGTQALSNPWDLARTADDANAGALRIMNRSGVNPTVAEEVTKAFTFQTRSGAHGLVDSAVNLGEANTVAFSYKSKMPLATLSKTDSPDTRKYLWLQHTADELNAAATAQTLSKQPKQGVPMVNGVTMPDVIRELTALEKSNPNLRNIGAGWRDQVASQRKFLSQGEYATMSPAKFKELSKTKPNTVMYDKDKTWEDQSPFQAMYQSMHSDMRHRMENEARGRYVDAMRKNDPSTFVRVTKDDLKQHTEWRKNTVTIYRRGQAEHYTTDPYLADVLKMDPYYISNQGNLAYGTKRMFERTTTGDLAPHFATTSMLRTYHQAKLTTPEGFKSPTILGTLAAVPKQLYPQIAKELSTSLNNASGGWLGSVLGQGNVNAMSLRLAQHYDNSLYHVLSKEGSHQGAPFMQHYEQTRGKFMQMVDGVNPSNKFYRGYVNLLDAMHNAPAFNFAVRNEGRVSHTELAARARGLTGDSRVGGQYRTGDGAPIRMEGTNPITTGAANMYGFAMDKARTSVPWANIIQQSTKKTLAAYAENPAKFVGRSWLYIGAPASATVFSAIAMGDDPNGQNYLDYMVNRRSEVDRIMNFYMPIPGKPAEQGIRFPRFQEGSIIGYMTENALYHMLNQNKFDMRGDAGKVANSLTRSPMFNATESAGIGMNTWRGVVADPPVPPLFNAALATAGQSGKYGMFGNTYRPGENPTEDITGMDKSLELMTRALAGGIADYVGVGLSAYLSTEEQFGTAVKNAATAVGKRVLQKTAVVNDIFGVERAATGSSAITEELFKKDKAMKVLAQFDNSGDTVTTKPVSPSGGKVREALLGEAVPEQIAGMSPKEPTNPLYKMFMDDVYRKLRTDRVYDERTMNPEGGIGYKSLWEHHGNLTAHIKSMRKVNEGNYVTWQKWLEERPEQVEYLKKHNIDTKSPVQVKNFYERKRQDTARVLLFSIKSVEQSMSERLGRPVKLEDLDPYGKGLPVPGQAQ